MTTENLSAGRTLDALVAERVMGKPPLNPPPYSTDIGAAWRVVEKMAAHYHWRIVSPFEGLGERWYAGLTPLGVSGWNGRPDYECAGATAPEAICRVALRAVKAS